MSGILREALGFLKDFLTFFKGFPGFLRDPWRFLKKFQGF